MSTVRLDDGPADQPNPDSFRLGGKEWFENSARAAWLERKDWQEFCNYEKELNASRQRVGAYHGHLPVFDGMSSRPRILSFRQ
jgi:hypothetical protein